MKSDQMVDLLEMGKGRAVDSVIPFCGASHLFHSVPSLKVECVCVRACVCVCVVCPSRTAVRRFEMPVVKNMVCLLLGVVIIHSCGHVLKLLRACGQIVEGMWASC